MDTFLKNMFVYICTLFLKNLNTLCTELVRIVAKMEDEDGLNMNSNKTKNGNGK